MRTLLVALVLLAWSPAMAEAPAPPVERAAPSEARPAAPTSKPAPRPAPRPAASPPNSGPEAPRFEDAPRRPPLAEPVTPYFPSRRYPAPVPIDRPGETHERPIFEPPVTPPIAPERDRAGSTRESESYEPKVARPAFETPLGEPDKRAWEGAAPVERTPRDVDHRTHRPWSHGLERHPDAHHPPPSPWYYHSCYAGWWVHPYYRWMYATIVIVNVPFAVYPWDAMWVPASRGGWMWVPGQWVGPYWYPGHWEPLSPAPYYYGASYAYVPGFWYSDAYFEGYWRVVDRPGFVWVDPWYADRTPMWGHWRPTNKPDDGYVWEAGFWNGEDWVEGFWRPESRVGYRWVSAAWDASGIFHAGYWEPIEPRPGFVWVPGWFDGVQWIQGYWVTESEYRAADPESWTPPVEWDAGSGTSVSREPDEPPLAIPVQ